MEDLLDTPTVAVGRLWRRSCLTDSNYIFSRCHIVPEIMLMLGAAAKVIISTITYL